MIVRMRFEFDDAFRRAVGHHYGSDCMAGRSTIKTTILMLVDAWVQDLNSDYDDATEEAADNAVAS